MAVVLVAAVLLLPKWGPVRSAVLTMAVVPELMNLPVRPLSAVTDAPTAVSTTYGAPGDRMDIYLPAGAADNARLPAVVLALGVHPQPIDHPEVTGIASAISRMGVVVGVPDSTALRNLVLTPAEPGHLVDAVLALRSRPEVDFGTCRSGRLLGRGKHRADRCRRRTHRQRPFLRQRVRRLRRRRGTAGRCRFQLGRRRRVYQAVAGRHWDPD